jgi:hypothetical protein
MRLSALAALRRDREQVRYSTVHYKTVWFKTVQNYKTGCGSKRYVPKQYSYKMVHVTKWYTVTKQYVAKWYSIITVVSRDQQKSTNTWVGWAFSLPNPTLDMVSYSKQNSTNPTNPFVRRLLLIVTDHIQGSVRLGLTVNQSMGWWNPVYCDCNVL